MTSERVKKLVDGLSSPVRKVREESIQALEDMGPEAKEALDALWLIASEEGNRFTHNRAIRAIVTITNDRTTLLSRSIDILQDYNFEQATTAITILVTLKPTGEDKDKVLKVLWEFIHKHDDPDQVGLIEDAFEAITEINPNSNDVIEHLLTDKKITSWEKSHLIMLRILREALNNKWKNDQARILPLVLGALKDKRLDVRRAAIDWLLDTALNDISSNLRPSVLDALENCFQQYGQGFRAIWQIGGSAAIEPLMSDSKTHPEPIGRFLLTTGRDFLEDKWTTDKETIIRFILTALKDWDWRIRRSAANWLREKASQVPSNLYNQIVQALEHQRNDDDPNVRDSVNACLIQLEQHKWDIEKSPLLEIIRSDKQEDAQKLQAIKKLADLETSEVFQVLIHEWVQWIAYGNKTLLVETTTEIIRSRPLAVLPLVNQFGQGLKQDVDLKDWIVTQIAPVENIELFQGLWQGKKIRKPDKPKLQQWFYSVENRSARFTAELTQRVHDERWSEEELARETLQLLVNDQLKERELEVRRRIAKQLADMSEKRFFNEELHNKFEEVRRELNQHAVPILGRRLPKEEDIDIRESLARLLANLGGNQAVDALTRAIVGEERTRAERQRLLATYYLEPSKKRSEETAIILKDAVTEARRTLRIHQILNIATYVIALMVLIIGFRIGFYSQQYAAQVGGILTGIGGFTGLIVQLMRNPLNRIQNAMASLVQIETAFTSFMRGLDLNNTYIQSQYVAEGILTEDEITLTLDRIQDIMSSTMSLVAIYAEERGQYFTARINNLFPVAGPIGSTICIYGLHLQANGRWKDRQAGQVAINHIPVQVKGLTWNEKRVKFKLPAALPRLGTEEGTIWVSLLIDGAETNALPFQVIRTN